MLVRIPAEFTAGFSLPTLWRFSVPFDELEVLGKYFAQRAGRELYRLFQPCELPRLRLSDRYLGACTKSDQSPDRNSFGRFG